MAEGGIPDVNTQKTSLGELLKSPLQKGDAWFLLSIHWFKQWKTYVGYDSWDTSNMGDKSYHPGPIDNSALLKDSNGPQLRENLVDELDYVMVAVKAWSDFLGWYGLVETQASPDPTVDHFQEPIKQHVIEQGMFIKHNKVEVHLMDLKLCKYPDLNTTITKQFSRESTVGQLEQEMKHIFHIAGTAEVVVVVQQNEDGSWLMVGMFKSASVTPRIKGAGKSTRTLQSPTPAAQQQHQHQQQHAAQYCGSKEQPLSSAAKAADIQQSSHVECTVCQELFDQPKLLPCGHTTCRKCLLSWLQTDGAGAGCPICRAAAVPSSRGNLSDLVDALPDDFAAMARVDSHKVLTGPHICSVCQGNVPASSYCFHCKVKLCSDCIIHHRKFPFLMEHTVEDLGKLSEQRLAECWQVMCSSHLGRPAELFCSAHGDVICALCSSTAHRGCERLEVISDAAKQKRDELREQVGVLELRNERLTKEMASVKDKFKPMQGVLKAAFDDLHKQIDQQHLHISDWLQKQENEVLTSMRPVETNLATVRYHTSSIKQVASSVPDGALLQMMEQLSTRLSDLEARMGSVRTVKFDWTVSIDQQKLNCLKSDLSKMVTKKATK